MENRLGTIYEEISEENAKLNTVAEENLAGVRTVKAFAREKFEIKKFLSHNNRYYELNMTQSRVFVRYSPYFSLIGKLLPLLVLLIGGYLFLQGELTLGALSAFVQYSTNIVWPMEMLGWLSNDFSSAVGSYRKIRKVYDQKPSIQEPEEPIVLPEVTGDIRFEHVSFHKEDQHEILHDIHFHVEAGKTIGIMGATGSGKTSLIQLLCRLYDATGGTIYLDNVDIRKLSLRQLRSCISTVMQDVFLFSDTIQENVMLGQKGNLNISDVRLASRDAQASEFIDRLSEQYDTVIGERGVGLSGGQKQRISIARALAKHTPVLVLDDSDQRTGYGNGICHPADPHPAAPYDQAHHCAPYQCRPSCRRNHRPGKRTHCRTLVPTKNCLPFTGFTIKPGRLSFGMMPDQKEVTDYGC